MRTQNLSHNTAKRTEPAFVGADASASKPQSASIHVLTPSTRAGQLRGIVRGTPVPPVSRHETAELLADIDGLPILVRFLVKDVPAELRSREAEIRSLLSSALAKMVDRMCGPSGRSDAVLKQPLATVELISSGEALIGQRARHDETMLRVGSLELDLMDRTARRGDRQIDLRPREFQLLKYMMQRPEQMLTRATLFKEVWRYKFVPESNLVDVHMGRLRRKVDGPNEPHMIRSVRGVGFVLSATPLFQVPPSTSGE